MKSVLSRVDLCLLGWWRRYWIDVLSFARAAVVVVRQSIVGGWTVCFSFFSLFSSVYDNCACVSSDVDNVAKITVGVVERIAELLATICREATPHTSLLIADFFMFIIHVYGYCDSWWWSWNLIVNCSCIGCFCVG